MNASAALLVFLAPATPLFAQTRTDVVRLANGDRITGEVLRLERGRLELKTDDAGTIYFEWDKIATVESSREFDVGTANGRRFLGSLSSGAGPAIVVVVERTGPVPLPMPEVTAIRPIGESFWKRLDGSADIGFDYTRSSQIAQLNLSTITVYRSEVFDIRVTLSGTLTRTGHDDELNDRGIAQASYLRYRGRWFVAAGAGFENNESLGLRLRSLIGAAMGLRLINTNRAQLMIGGGLAGNDERGLEGGRIQNLEGVVLFRSSYYAYDRPRTASMSPCSTTLA